jgi:hypothetical protein
MKSFKHFLKIKEQNINFVEKNIAIHASFGHHLNKENNLEESLIKEETENVITKPHSDEDIKKFHSENKVKDEKLSPEIGKDHPGWIHYYTQGESTHQNDALWNHHNNKKLPSDEWDRNKHHRNLAFANQASNVLQNHRTSRDFTVFSGINQDHAEKLKNQNEPLKVHHPAMMSTSTDFEQASKFTGGPPKSGQERHVLRIAVPKGTASASVKSVSQFKKENEVLLDRGHELEIHHKPTIIHHPKYGKIHVWQANIIGHNPKKLNTKPIKDVLYKDEKSD